MISQGWIPSEKNDQPPELNAGEKRTSRDKKTTPRGGKNCPQGTQSKCPQRVSSEGNFSAVIRAVFTVLRDIFCYEGRSSVLKVPLGH